MRTITLAALSLLITGTASHRVEDVKIAKAGDAIEIRYTDVEFNAEEVDFIRTSEVRAVLLYHDPDTGGYTVSLHHSFSAFATDLKYRFGKGEEEQAKKMVAEVAQIVFGFKGKEVDQRPK